MIRTSFNDDWRVRPKVNAFMELVGGGAQPWVPVRLPHDAMIDGTRDSAGEPANGYFPGGVWEYQKTFIVPEPDRGKRILVEFEGVYRGARVYVNGTLAGHRPYGYSNFAVSIGEHLHYGDENTISVEATAHRDSRWYSGAGIYRDVHLVVGEPVHIALDGVQVTTPEVDDDAAVIAIATVVENDSTVTMTTSVTTELVDDSGAVIASDVAPLTVFPGRRETLRQRLFLARPRRWSVEQPVLYACRTVLAGDEGTIDRASTGFGIRTLSADAERGLRINGKPVELRGACIHHDNGVLGSATIARADARRVEKLKEAGFNAVRSAHQPLSRAMLAACDRVGMLVMDETFDMWTEPKMEDDYSHSFPDWWEADVDAMVMKDRNHPCVIMYSIGNEIPDTGRPSGAGVGRAIAERIRALDDTRLVTNSINPMLSVGMDVIASLAGGIEITPTEDTGINTMMAMMEQFLPIILQNPVVDERTAESYAYLDVAGYNYTESRYAMDRELHPHRVIVGSENRPPSIAANWQLVREHPHVLGDFTWTGWDYLGEAGIGRAQYASEEIGGFMGEYPWLTAHCGDFDITGHRRPVSYWREIVWGRRAEPYVAVRPPAHHGEATSAGTGWSFTDAVATWSWPGFEDQPVTVEVYADADEVELLVDGTSVGRAPAGQGHKYRAVFETTYSPGDLTAVAYRDGSETGRTSLVTATGEVLLDVRVDRPLVDADDRDLAYVEIALVDAGGNLHFGDDRAVTVAIEGPAVLQGLGSGNPCTEETFSSSTHDTYQGRALAVIRPTGEGTITVTVSTKGCDDRTVTVSPSNRRGRAPVTWELRWHPFRGEWVLFTAHRGARPWIGETVADDEPAIPDDNALAPLGKRIDTTNPDYRGVFVFTNDLPVFSPDAPEPNDGDDLYRTRRALGAAEVVCYHHDPAKSMADLSDDEVAAVVRTWRDRTAALQAIDGVAHVLIFENRGAAVGTSNPHPHCQIYAGALVYGIAEREDDVAAAHFAATGREIISDVVERESSGGRVLDANDHFFACVPWFARYAYEVLVLPRQPVTSLVDFDDDRCRALGTVLRDVVHRYDELWGIRMPYVLAIHQAPVGDHPHYPFHVELHPPLRAPGLMKYLAGPEIGGGSMTNESDPDEKAAELRGALP